jgi:GNAT superfamily N-acetyltransferase
MQDARFTVRLAATADTPALVDLMAEFYAESSVPLDRAWAAGAFAALLADPARGAVWLFECDRQPVGHVVLTVKFAMEFGGLSAIIDDLFVRVAYRSRGIAGAGVEALVADARRRGCVSLHVEVDPANAPATALYRRIGLKPGTDARLHLGTRLLPAG